MPEKLPLVRVPPKVAPLPSVSREKSPEGEPVPAAGVTVTAKGTGWPCLAERTPAARAVDDFSLGAAAQAETKLAAFTDPRPEPMS